MKERLKTCRCVLLLTLFLAITASAQPGGYVEDYRVIKYRKEIFQKVYGANTLFDLKDFDLKVMVIKRLEIYDKTPKLLVTFSQGGDHNARVWGILTANDHYFFYDADDTTETDFQRFKHKYDLKTVETIFSYCYQEGNYDSGGFIPKSIAAYQQNLTTVKDAIYHKQGLTAAKVDSATTFLADITGINSKPDDNSNEKYPLTRADYTRWLIWLRENGKRLQWDRATGKVRVKVK